MEEKLQINVNIAEKNFPLQVEVEKEHIYRRAAKVLNSRLLDYRRKYESMSDKDFLGMLAYEYLVQTLKKNDDIAVDVSLKDLAKMDEELTTIIDNLYK